MDQADNLEAAVVLEEDGEYKVETVKRKKVSFTVNTSNSSTRAWLSRQ